MSAAVPRAQETLEGNNESSQPAANGELAVRPVIEATGIAGASLVNDHGMTPLMNAARDGSAGTVRALLMRAADVNARRSDGFNALSLAAFFGHSQVVWLLLENGADIDATDRSNTTPELWADARGFIDIGNILREARARKEAETSSRRSPLMDEPVRFPRAAGHEDLQRAGDPEPVVEAPVIIDAVSDATSTVRIPVCEEKALRRNESASDILPGAAPEQSQQHPVIHQPPRELKALPEILDPPPLVVPAFHPGSAFVARITSSWESVSALILVSLLLCVGIAALLIPQIGRSWADERTKVATEPAHSTSESGNPVAGSGSDLPVTVETPAAPSESTTSDFSSNTEGTTANANRDESPSRLESVVVSETGSKSSANAGSSTSGGDRILKAGENKRELPAVKVLAPVAAPSRKTVSRGVESQKQAVAEEQTKPAPLSVEGSRARREPSPPAKIGNEVSGSQSAPLHIISDKPKSKVIQWP